MGNTYFGVAAKHGRVDVGSGRLQLPDWPSGVYLLDALVEVEESCWRKDVCPGSPELDQCLLARMVGALKDVAEGDSDVGAKQLLVRIRVIFNDGVHEVKDRQLQVWGGNL